MNCRLLLTDGETDLTHRQEDSVSSLERLKSITIIPIVSVHSTDLCRGQNCYGVT